MLLCELHEGLDGLREHARVSESAVVFEGLKKRIKESQEAAKARAQEQKQQAVVQKNIYSSTYKREYRRSKNEATYKAAISSAHAQAQADVAKDAQGRGPAFGAKIGLILGGAASGFQKATKYGKSDPFGMGGGSSNDPFGIGSLTGGGGGGKRGSSQPDYLGLGSLGLGEPSRPAHRKKSSKGKTITIHVK